MSQGPVVCTKNALSRDLDVQVSISRPQTELATDMTLHCFLTPEPDFPPDNGRVRYYSTFEALQADARPNGQMYWAGKAFFDRAVRPLSLAVGKVFEEAVPAGLAAGSIDFAALAGISDGAFSLELNGATVQVSGLNLSGARSLADAAAALTGKIEGATASVKYGTLAIETVTGGAGTALGYAAAPETGTDVSGLLGLTQAAGATCWPGYAPAGLAAEAALVRQASRCNNRPIYGWTLDAKYRDSQAQKDLADWAESLSPAWFSACTNSPAAYNPADSENLGCYARDRGYKRTSVLYHHNPQVYPEVSYLAEMLATNYSLPASAKTAKFKQLDGIEPSPLSETQLSALNARRINCYVSIGNNARTVREGVQSLDTWYSDTLVNLDNFREELQVEVYNVFLRNPKVPYTAAGQDKLVSAAAKICNKYVRNGVFADRDLEAPEQESGFRTAPATSIEPVPVAFATASERAARLAPPIRITAYETSAFHQVSIQVDVFN